MRGQTEWVWLLALIAMASAATAETGSVTGSVSLQATKKTQQPKRYYTGPYRSGRRGHHDATDGPQHVVVYLEGASGRPDSATFQPEPVIRQKDERFIPHVLPVQVGTSVGFPNEDNFYHNVFSVMAGDRFDLGRYAQGETTFQKFHTPGVVVVRCEIHPGMKAYIMVLETGFFTVPDSLGAFSISGVPAGTYQLHAWHPEHGARTRTITVPASGKTRADIAF